MPRMRKIYLSDTDKKIAGVCGGIGERFSIDSTLVRLAFVFVSLVTAIFPVLLTYIVAALIIPHKPRVASAGEAWGDPFEGMEQQ